MTGGILEQTNVARMLYLGVILVMLVATAGALRRQSFVNFLQNLVVWLALFAVLLTGYAFRSELEEAGYRVLGMLDPGRPVPGSTPGSVMVAKSRDGHFYVRATVSGKPVQMIVDTGASSVVLSDHDAAALGIRPRLDAYTVTTSTANGQTSTAPVVLGDVTVGTISLRNVPALVAQPNALESSLLGNSFLERLKSFTFEGDRLKLQR